MRRVLTLSILRVLLFLGLGLVGCTQITVRPLSPDEIGRLRAAADPHPHAYAIERGDTIAIHYTYHPDMNQEETVRPDGKISANLVGVTHVAGLTTVELQQMLEQATSDRLRAPEVSVRIVRQSERHVYVGGEVEKPGPVPYQRGLTALQAVVAAGGFRDTARLDTVVLIRTDRSGQTLLSRTIDLQEAVSSGVKESLPLAPRDVVFVPRSRIAEADLWVRQHITDLIPIFRGFSLPMPLP